LSLGQNLLFAFYRVKNKLFYENIKNFIESRRTLKLDFVKAGQEISFGGKVLVRCDIGCGAKIKAGKTLEVVGNIGDEAQVVSDGRVIIFGKVGSYAEITAGRGLFISQDVGEGTKVRAICFATILGGIGDSADVEVEANTRGEEKIYIRKDVGENSWLKAGVVKIFGSIRAHAAVEAKYWVYVAERAGRGVEIDSPEVVIRRGIDPSVEVSGLLARRPRKSGLLLLVDRTKAGADFHRDFI